MLTILAILAISIFFDSSINNLVPYRDYVTFIAYDIPGRTDNCLGPTLTQPDVGTFRYDFTTCTYITHTVFLFVKTDSRYTFVG